MLAFELFMFALEGAKRHQGENWISFQRRMIRETDSLEESTGAGRNYAYIRMDCGHLLMVRRGPSTYLATGDEYWCFGHGRLHGAQLQHIVDPDASHDMTPEDYANMVI